MFSIFKRVSQLEAEVVALHAVVRSLQSDQTNMPKVTAEKFEEKVRLLDSLLKKSYARDYYYKVTKPKLRAKNG